MAEDRSLLLSPSLTPVQLAFLVSLLPGPRPTGDCHDAITVGGLMRLNLVDWGEPNHRLERRLRRGTFLLTEAGAGVLAGLPLPSQLVLFSDYAGRRNRQGSRRLEGSGAVFVVSDVDSSSISDAF